MERKEIESKISNFLIETLEYESSAISPSAKLKEDLGMSSLDAVETRLFILKNFGVQLEREDILTIRTLDDLYSFVEKKQTT